MNNNTSQKKLSILEMMEKSDKYIEKQLLYINECLINMEHNLTIPKEHHVFLLNLRTKLTLRYIIKYDKLPHIQEVKEYYNN